MKKSTLLLLATILMFNSPVQAAAAVDEAEQNLSFPKPSGPYSIGYQHVELTDKERIDPYNPKPEQNRQVKVTVWYPSQDAAKLENYSIDEMALSEQNKEQILKNLPPDLRVQTQQAIDRHAQIKIYRSFNAQPAQGKFPVIVLSPGWGNKSVSYQRIGQELVSHGYIVMAIHHPYLTGRVKFRDGVVKARENIESEEALRIFTADVAFVLKSLPDISSQLGLQETDRIGLMGHSLGGEATMRTVHNPLFKVRAAVHLDSLLIPEPLSQEEQELGPLFAKERETSENPLEAFPNRKSSGGLMGFNLPFMHILAGSLPKDEGVNGAAHLAIKDKTFCMIPCKEHNYKVRMSQGTHGCFGDANFEKHLVPGLAIQEVWGPPEPHFEANYRDTDLLLRTFFDKFLKGADVDLLKLNSLTVRIEGDRRF